MNLSEIKLVVCDMDGTLLNSQSQISDTFFELFERLKRNHIHFVAASGRQYNSIINKLTPIVNDITIIAENGGITKKNNKELLVVGMELSGVHELIFELRKIKDIHIILCGKYSSYIETQDSTFIAFFSEYYESYTKVDDLTQVTNDEIVKIAVYHKENSEKYIYPYIKQFESKFQVKISAKNWLDLSHLNANKGIALEKLQQQMGISKEETMVFGDYNNDLEMIDKAYFSYAMQNAHPNVKAAANFETRSNDENGVEFILSQLIEQKEK